MAGCCLQLEATAVHVSRLFVLSVWTRENSVVSCSLPHHSYIRRRTPYPFGLGFRVSSCVCPLALMRLRVVVNELVLSKQQQ